MKTSGVSSRGEFKTSGWTEFVEVDDEMGKLHAARNEAPRTNEDILKKSRREGLFFI
jgi:hypothetical protein